jgi:hypothetical protein
MRAKPKNREIAIFATAVILALLATPAYAQSSPEKDKVDHVDPPALNKALDRQYNDALNRIPTPKSSNDPWASVRASDVTKPKDDKKKSVTGATATK